MSYREILYLLRTFNAFSVGFSNLIIIRLKFVPANVPLIPALANNPIAEAASLNETPAKLIIGAANFIASPISGIVVLLDAVTIANISATCPILPESMP